MSPVNFVLMFYLTLSFFGFIRSVLSLYCCNGEQGTVDLIGWFYKGEESTAIKNNKSVTVTNLWQLIINNNNNNKRINDYFYLRKIAYLFQYLSSLTQHAVNLKNKQTNKIFNFLLMLKAYISLDNIATERKVKSIQTFSILIQQSISSNFAYQFTLYLQESLGIDLTLHFLYLSPTN